MKRYPKRFEQSGNGMLKNAITASLPIAVAVKAKSGRGLAKKLALGATAVTGALGAVGAYYGHKFGQHLKKKEKAQAEKDRKR